MPPPPESTRPSPPRGRGPPQRPGGAAAGTPLRRAPSSSAARSGSRSGTGGTWPPARAKPGGVMELSPAARSSRRRRDLREDHGERRPLAQLRRDVDRAAVGAHDALRKREAQSGPLLLRFRREERLEEVFGGGPRDSRPRGRGRPTA